MIELGLVFVAALKRRPIPFTLTSITGWPKDTLYETNTVPVGYEGNPTLVGTPTTGIYTSTEVRKNDTGSWVSGVRLSSGDKINARGMSASTFANTRHFAVSIDTTSATFDITTCTDPALAFANVTSAATNTIYVVNSVMHSDASQTVTVTGGQVGNDNSTWGSSTVVPAGQKVYVRQTSSSSSNTTTTANVTCAGIVTQWTVQTVASANPPNLVYQDVHGHAPAELCIYHVHFTAPNNGSGITVNFTASAGCEVSNSTSFGWGSSANVAAGAPVYARGNYPPAPGGEASYPTTLTYTISGLGYNYYWTLYTDGGGGGGDTS